LENALSGLEETVTLIVCLPLDKDNGTLCTCKQALRLLVLVQDSVFLILISVVKVSLSLRHRHGQESVLKLDTSITNVCEASFDPDELSKARSRSVPVPGIWKTRVVFRVVLVHFDICIANNSILVFKIGKGSKELANMGVPGVVNEKKEGLDMSGFRSGLIPAH
jgi:hypothetical protein